ncbi:c-type cytochrome biogenesis protein CcsB [Homoserinibacter sp. YIM 151385]|uniref:c-type cytochrome biogenesis protein CcsB n=1 Tax=Homoserinibacter sp. YIM 151385 TaxID=2985506 RepID=UPI0022F095AD|nr:c-type cytochrome biogenesis protein CcsB [Homoserinibacter sp. YIM 151385]WBU39384.1 c-type cytochrome biogenesis protein CcsB [Homoserinibacter sp. YIM 151385]
MSLIAVYSAAVVYTLAFIVYTLDLAKRSARPTAAVQEREAVLAGAGAAAAGAAAAGASDAPGASVSPYRPEQRDGGATGPADRRYQRVAFALTALAWVIHAGAVLLRGFAAERVPWANMFEFALTGTAIIAGVFLLVQVWRDLRFLGAYITGMVVLLLVSATMNFYVDVAPLPPALQSAWLVVHVLVAILATGFFAVGAGLSIVQLLQHRRDLAGGETKLGFLRTMPSAETLETLANRVIIVGFVFWTFTLIFGAIWASFAWGRYWGWDTKEVWTFVIWVVFAGYIHARATRGWAGTRSAWLALIGFAAVLFNFTVVNLFFKGLHAYSGL